METDVRLLVLLPLVVLAVLVGLLLAPLDVDTVVSVLGPVLSAMAF